TAINVGVDTLRVNPMRTALSTLGIIIGVAALVAVLAIGDGMERYIRAEVERTTDVQTVFVIPRRTVEVDGRDVPVRDFPVFADRDAALAAREIPGLAELSLTVSGNAVIEAPHRTARRAAGVTATMANGADFLHLRFAEGRFFTDAESDRDRPVVVLSNRLALELAGGRSAESLVGRTVRVRGNPRLVIGVLAPYRGERALEAYVPLRAAATVLEPTGAPIAPVLLLRAGQVEGVDGLRSRVEDWLARRYENWTRRVRVETQSMRLEQAQRGLGQFRALMAAITGISLLVGGIGIMNVLLASVTERTREIGIRKATGARRRDVLLQFLAESVAISGFGSAIGLVLGFAGAWLIAALMRSRAHADGLYPSLSGTTLLVAVLSAVLVGLAFGTYPARRAARLSPIEAMRHE
ncbi:MAG TPA: ABC transporter permease, partial [Gemmatimonadaceae bacterium]|nr:ABC transporter permease [Gemmatimonadaceae bacterium]